MHYNSSLAPEQIRISEKLRDAAKEKEIAVETIMIKGIDQLMQFIEEEFSSSQLRQLASVLGVSRELITFDQIRSIIDDLIRGVDVDLENIAYGLQINITDKIELNYSTQDISAAKEEYEDLILDGTLKKIGAIISTYENEQINILKLKVKREFNKSVGTFKQKVEMLTENLLNKYSSGNDDEIEHYVRSLLIYCFEQCLIGERTKDELEKQNL
jgi:hypothetical protein